MERAWRAGVVLGLGFGVFVLGVFFNCVFSVGGVGSGWYSSS